MSAGGRGKGAMHSLLPPLFELVLLWNVKTELVKRFKASFPNVVYSLKGGQLVPIFRKVGKWSLPHVQHFGESFGIRVANSKPNWSRQRIRTKGKISRRANKSSKKIQANANYGVSRDQFIFSIYLNHLNLRRLFFRTR